MTLADEIRAASKATGGRCTIGVALADMPDKQRTEWEAVFSDAGLDGTAIARVLTKHTGRRIQGQTVNRHRRGECACGDIG